MNSQQPGYDYTYYNNVADYNDVTQPLTLQAMPSATAPLPPFTALPRQNWAERSTHWLGRLLSSIINKIRALLALALLVVWLLLTGRFLLMFFTLTHSVFSHWVFSAAAFLMFPFNNLIPAFSYNGYTIDISTLVAMAVYMAAALIVRRFLRILVTRE
jgi:hypothetical protein